MEGIKEIKGDIVTFDEAPKEGEVVQLNARRCGRTSTFQELYGKGGRVEVKRINSDTIEVTVDPTALKLANAPANATLRRVVPDDASQKIVDAETGITITSECRGEFSNEPLDSDFAHWDEDAPTQESGYDDSPRTRYRDTKVKKRKSQIRAQRNRQNKARKANRK